VNVAPVDARLSRIAAAIGEPARTRMLCCLLDGHARTSTELAAVADVTPSTASAHLARLKDERLVKILAQGKHRYYSLESAEVAEALETLMILAGGPRDRFVPGTPPRLRAARTCYDHMAGAMAVSLHDRLRDRRWIVSSANDGDYEITEEGASALERLGVDVRSARASRRRLAYPCVDWSERRPHVGGALGAALLALAVRRRWVDRDLDSRILTVTPAGRREMRARFGVEAGVREAPAGERSTSTT
jgi:DNA-binding transcriptional ArsR family regulator